MQSLAVCICCLQYLAYTEPWHAPSSAEYYCTCTTDVKIACSRELQVSNTMVHTRCTDQQTPELTGACTLCLLVADRHSTMVQSSSVHCAAPAQAQQQVHLILLAPQYRVKESAPVLASQSLSSSAHKSGSISHKAAAESEATSDACQNMTVPVPALVKHSPNIL